MKTPKWVTQRLVIGGNNLYGQPLYRIVWSEDRHEISYGKQIKKYGNGLNRWIMEKWCSPESYAAFMPPEQWNSYREDGELVMGPFPNQGDYEECYRFDVDGIAIPLGGDLINLMVKAIERGKMYTRSQKWAALKEAQAKREADEHQRFSDAFDDALPAFDKEGVGQEFVATGKTGARPKKPEDYKIVLTDADIPLNLPRRGFKQLGD